MDIYEKSINVHAPIGGINAESPTHLLNERECVTCHNVVFEKGAVHTCNGNLLYASGLVGGGTIPSAPIMALYDYKETAGTWHKVAFTTSRAYEIITGHFQQMGITAWTGSRDKLFSFAEFTTVALGKHLVVTNGYDPIRYWTGAGNWTQLSGGPLYAKFALSYFNHLFLFYNIVGGSNNPTLVRWCAVADDANWTTADSGGFDLLDTPGDAVGGAVLGTSMIVFKEDFIYRVEWNGYTFSAVPLAPGIGCAAPLSIQPFKGGVGWLGFDKAYWTDGMQVISISDKLFRNFLDLPYQYLKRTVGSVDTYRRIYRLNVPSGDGLLYESWIYDYSTGVWAKDSNTTSSRRMGRTAESFADISLSKTWNYFLTEEPNTVWINNPPVPGKMGIAGSWDDLMNSANPRVRIIAYENDATLYQETTQVYKDRTYFISSDWYSKEFAPGTEHVDTYYFWKQLSIEARGSGLLKVFSVESEEDVGTLLGSITLTPEYAEKDIWFTLTKKSLKLRFSCTDGYFWMKWFRLVYSECSGVPE
jgi:hypothetical protein